MDAKGCLKVNQYLQVEGLHDVFAVGDCSGADDECKMAYKGALHANIAAQNIQNLADEKPLKQYNPRKCDTVCEYNSELGENQGRSQTFQHEREARGRGLICIQNGGSP